MCTRTVSTIALLLGAACSDSTPPIVDPVTHDVTLTFKSMRFDFQTTTYPMNQSFTGTLAVDFLRAGAAFEMVTNPPCIFTRGAVALKGESVQGEFHGGDYSPLLTLTGVRDPNGVIQGDFSCLSHYGGSPHHDSYSGTFQATPRP